MKDNLLEVLAEVSRAEHPDFVIVPDRLIAQADSYLELSRLGQPESQHRRQLEASFGRDITSLISEVVEVYDLGENSLLAWYVWFDSWLRQAGSRLTYPVAYLPPDAVFGRRV